MKMKFVLFLMLFPCVVSAQAIWVPAPPPQRSRAMAAEPNVVEMLVPQGWEFQSLDDQGNFRTVVGGGPIKISCECSTGGDCMPLYIVYNAGSSILDCGGSCLICIKKIGGAQIVSAGFVRTEKTVRVAADVSSLPPAFDAMFHDQATVALVEDFVARAWGGTRRAAFAARDAQAQAPSGTALVGLNVRGHGLLVAVPAEYARAAEAGAAKGSCSCTEGKCSFETKTLPGGGSMFYCSAGCTGVCTLSMSGAVSPVGPGAAIERR